MILGPLSKVALKKVPNTSLVCSKSIRDECGKTTSSFLSLVGWTSDWPFFSSILVLGTCNINAHTNVDTHRQGIYLYIYIYWTNTGVFKLFGNMDTFFARFKSSVHQPSIMPDFLLWHCGNSHLEAWEAFECVLLACDFFQSSSVSWFSDPHVTAIQFMALETSFHWMHQRKKPELLLPIYHNFLLHWIIIIHHPFSHPNWICYPLLITLHAKPEFFWFC